MGRPVNMAPTGREVPPGRGSPSYGSAPHPPRGWPLVRSSQLVSSCLSCLSPVLSCGTPGRTLECGRDRFSDLLDHRGRLEVALIDVAPTPLLATLIRHVDRMRRRSEVFGPVLVPGAIAAADVAAGVPTYRRARDIPYSHCHSASQPQFGQDLCRQPGSASSVFVRHAQMMAPV